MAKPKPKALTVCWWNTALFVHLGSSPGLDIFYSFITSPGSLIVFTIECHTWLLQRPFICITAVQAASSSPLLSNSPFHLILLRYHSHCFRESTSLAHHNDAQLNGVPVCEAQTDYSHCHLLPTVISKSLLVNFVTLWLEWFSTHCFSFTIFWMIDTFTLQHEPVWLYSTDTHYNMYSLHQFSAPSPYFVSFR